MADYNPLSLYYYGCQKIYLYQFLKHQIKMNKLTLLEILSSIHFKENISVTKGWKECVLCYLF